LPNGLITQFHFQRSQREDVSSIENGMAALGFLALTVLSAGVLGHGGATNYTVGDTWYAGYTILFMLGEAEPRLRG
jgi:hypothetical protein